jgi:glycosyltransferase involved in cell wall biosynthesis
MLTVVIATHNHERALVATLQMLVPGALEGVVRQVIIADAGSTDQTRAVADEAGCEILDIPAPLGNRLRTAAAKARAPWLMFLRPGAVIEAGWTIEAHRFVEGLSAAGWADGQAAVFRRNISVDEFRPALARTLALARALFASSPTGEQGLLIAKRLYDELGGHRDNADPEADLLARLGRRRIVHLHSAAYRVDDDT